jgi:hypothetical protein
MGAAVTAAAAAAAAREREQEQVLECFRLADATAAGRAQTLERLGLVGDVTVERLFKAGVVLPGSEPHTVYLSEAALVAYRRVSKSRAVWLLLIAGLMFLGLGAAIVIFATQAPGR